jgi:hypothetical protein
LRLGDGRPRHDRRGAELIGERNDRCIRFRLEVGGQSPRVCRRVLDCTRSVAGCHECQHQLPRDGRIVRLGGCPASPALGGARRIAQSLMVFRSVLEASPVRPNQL